MRDILHYSLIFFPLLDMPIDVAHPVVASKNADITSQNEIHHDKEFLEPKAEVLCGSCIKHKKKIEQLQSDIEKLRKENARLKRDNDELIKQNIKLQESSEGLTSTMASVLENSGTLENVNDEFSNTNLSKQFQKLYDNKWVELSEWFGEFNPDLTEFKRVKALTALMKFTYKECLTLADDQIRRFLFQENNEDRPLSNEEVSLFKVRRVHGQLDSTRNSVAKKILCKVLHEDNISALLSEENKEEAKKKLEEFFREFIDLCWLMLISHPRLLLEFDVIGEPYNSVNKEHFQQFSTQELVESSEMEKGCIWEVVWPCVILEDKSGVFKKGDIITVDVGKKTSSSIEQE